MAENDQTTMQTPADQRRRRRSGILVLCLFLLLVIAGLSAAVLAVNDGRNYRRLAYSLGLQHYLLPQSAPPILRVADPKKRRMADVYPPRLLAMSTKSETSLERAQAIDAEQRCKSLKMAQQTEAPGFTVKGKDWECLMFQPFGAGPDGSSFFLQARGKLPDTTQTMRIKLNLTDTATQATVINEAIAALDRFGLPLSKVARDYLADRMSTLSKFTSTMENYRVKFDREFMDDRRYNLVLLPLPQTADCGEPPEMQPSDAAAQTYKMPIGCLTLRSPAAQRPTDTAS